MCTVVAGDRELHDVLPADRGDQLLGAVERYDPPVIHDGDPVAQALCLIHIVSGENDGASRLLQTVHQIP